VGSLIADLNFKFDLLAFSKCFEAVHRDHRAVNEGVLSQLSCSMKPYPLALLNHITFPLAIELPSQHLISVRAYIETAPKLVKSLAMF
jgi:hypothetical protein